ncbi:hypothetical protein CC1G_00414 [Coprinopsis cinerea okayama7|uniref:Uncharacterized protein n=1 Tax=Coprinopsis cinerea (strain Okayama-7 / 130 / ATCC MYA-4618 / FGSC 9003) TaxID=240176 RepID=A8NXV4_COPC7|nr:hypothetical protein CC1G_00414 [Coprinopsis cinerea okayama7\|eukprot:XP_001837278.2 hypothetical protein CC1G_00414 [Coprinopsis cinerea okayama7\
MALAFPPTPPLSPQHNPIQREDTPCEDPLKDTMSLLDSLIAYYQQERMWVYRTRASLENAFPEKPTSDSGLAMAEPCSPPPDRVVGLAKVEDDHDQEKVPERRLSARSATSSPSRWSKRKKGFKMRLELTPQPKRSLSVSSASSNGSSGELGDLPPRERLLAMFEKMMETRMESCERVNKLIRNANRAHLHLR